jgi:geranylgeranyl diphosphate synthase, type II
MQPHIVAQSLRSLFMGIATFKKNKQIIVFHIYLTYFWGNQFLTMNTSEALLKQINQALQAINLPKKPARLYDPIHYVLSMGGKRLRPTICLMAAELFTDDNTKALKPALALEIFHNFTLLHDDIMDNAPTRRGVECVHIHWDNNVAILSGDAMQILAYQIFGEAHSDFLSQGLPLFSQTALEVCEGQQFDMDFETQETVCIDEYMHMIRLKTAVLIAASLKLGAMAGGASAKDADLLYEFGIRIGLAFQLKDDLLDVYGDPNTFGKRIGGDIVCNKRTFMLIHALHLSSPQDRVELEHWISDTKTGNEAEKIAAVTQLFNKCGIQNLCIQKMDTLQVEALEILRQVSVTDARKKILFDYANELIDRTK